MLGEFSWVTDPNLLSWLYPFSKDIEEGLEKVFILTKQVLFLTIWGEYTDNYNCSF